MMILMIIITIVMVMMMVVVMMDARDEARDSVRHLVDCVPSSSSGGPCAGWLTRPPLPRGTSRMLRVKAIVPDQSHFTCQLSSSRFVLFCFHTSIYSAVMKQSLYPTVANRRCTQ